MPTRAAAKQAAAERAAAARKEADERRLKKKFAAMVARLLRGNPELRAYVEWRDGEYWADADGLPLLFAKMRLDGERRRAAWTLCEMSASIQSGTPPAESSVDGDLSTTGS
eukprot:jgi/Mesvir1/14648/Mv05318-RA.1